MENSEFLLSVCPAQTAPTSQNVFTLEELEALFQSCSMTLALSTPLIRPVDRSMSLKLVEILLPHISEKCVLETARACSAAGFINAEQKGSLDFFNMAMLEFGCRVAERVKESR